MIEQAIEIQTADGTADGFLYRGEDARRRPGVIHLTDIGGVRPSHRDMAHRLAAKGFTVLLPNVFYRTGRPPMFDFTPSIGEERTMKRFAELAVPLTPTAMERDAAAYVDFLAAHALVSEGAMGVVGYCFTGSMAIRTAAVRPGKIAAAASFHGAGSSPMLPLAPILCCRGSRLSSISDTRLRTRACRGLRLKSSTARSLHGAVNTRAKCMRAPITDGRQPMLQSTTARKPIALSKS